MMISDIPFNGPIGGVKIGMVDGDLVINPTHEQIENGQLELVIASGEKGVLMIEAGASQVSDERMAEAIDLAHRVIQPVIQLQKELQARVGKPKSEMQMHEVPPHVVDAIDAQFGEQIKNAIATPSKSERNEALDEARKAVKAALSEQFGDDAKSIGNAMEKLAKKYTRQMILGEGKRPDGRA
jgi:polyribonucleotide nucleotidyltransferase